LKGPRRGPSQGTVAKKKSGIQNVPLDGSKGGGGGCVDGRVISQKGHTGD